MFVYFLLFLLTSIWGSTFIFSKVVLDTFSVSFVTTIRFFIAGLFFYITFHRQIKFNKSVLLKGSLIGFLNGVALIFQLVGLKFTTASSSAFITASYILFLPFIEFFISKNRFGKGILFGIFMAFLGMFFMSFNNINDFSLNIGDLFTLICGFLYAFQIFYIGKYTKTENIYSLIFIQFFISFIVGFLYLLFEDRTFLSYFHNFSSTPWLFLFFLGIIGTFFTFSLQFYIQKKLSSIVAGVGYLMEPVFALFMAIIFLQETIHLQKIISVFMILSGILIVILAQKQDLLKNKVDFIEKM